MKEQKILSDRITRLCRERGISYYELSYKSTVPMSTLMHIIDCSTKNPGIFTIIKICNGLGITITAFFDTQAFSNIEYDLD